MRYAHFIIALGLGVLVYPAWADDSTVIAIERFAIYPILTVTGAALWIGRIKAMEKAAARKAGSGIAAPDAVGAGEDPVTPRSP